MKVYELIEKVEDKDIEEVELNYEGDVQKFYSLDDFREEVESYGLDEEEVKKYKVKNQVLYINI